MSRRQQKRWWWWSSSSSSAERERERERAKGDAVLVVFSASTRWLWWKRTTGLIQTRRLCDFCWDYGRGNIPIHFSSSKSRRFETARRRRRKEQPRNDDSFFRPRRKKTRGKETLTIRFSWPPLGSKTFQQKGTQKLLLGCQKRRDIFAEKKKERTAKKKVVRKT